MRLEMRTLKQDRGDAERELMVALANNPLTNGPVEICPSAVLLRSFFDGSVADEAARQQILSHLGGCRICLQKMRTFRKQRLRLRVAVYASAAVLVFVACVLWFSPKQKTKGTESLNAVVVDFNQPVVRGMDDPAIKVAHTTRQLQIILPSGSAAGSYEIELLAPGTNEPAAMMAPAETKSVNGTQQLNVSVNFERLRAGHYLLGIQRGSDVWAYRTLILHSQ